MSRLQKGDKVFIQSFKHNGSLHRTWSKALVLEDNDDCIVAVTDHTWVVEADGRKWLTKEPAICFFYKHRWFNVISMVRKAGIYYYCNIASPSLVDEEAIKNIDYDLDVKVFPDGEHMILDQNEYKYHASQMKYPSEIMDIVEKEMDALVKMVENKEAPFDLAVINGYLMDYFRIIFEEGEKTKLSANE